MSAPALRDIHTLFYRGYLKSCNYHCGYCPFHKHARNDKKRDEAALWRMVDHLPLLGTPLNVMITPYGEALRLRYYMAALAEISRYPHVQAVGIQTNASFSLMVIAGIISCRRRRYLKASVMVFFSSLTNYR